MNNEETQSRIDFYSKVYKDFRLKVGDETVAALLTEQVAKDLRIQAMRGGDSASGNAAKAGVGSEESATSAQLGFLKRLGIALPKDMPLTKASASAMIDQALAGR